MKNVSAQQLLRSPEPYPDSVVVKGVLPAPLYGVYLLLQDMLTAKGLDAGWQYYADGKAWLCKITRKKKTVAWLSLWDNRIQLVFYFTEKTRPGVLELQISHRIKEAFVQAGNMGKLIPLVLHILESKDVNELDPIFDYKLSLK